VWERQACELSTWAACLAKAPETDVWARVAEAGPSVGRAFSRSFTNRQMLRAAPALRCARRSGSIGGGCRVICYQS
jgi:hypothetical protein